MTILQLFRRLFRRPAKRPARPIVQTFTQRGITGLVLRRNGQTYAWSYRNDQESRMDVYCHAKWFTFWDEVDFNDKDLHCVARAMLKARGE